MPREISRIEVLNGCKRLLEGPERQVISDLMELINAHDSDLILCPMPTPGPAIGRCIILFRHY
jgi:hypothetical protein